MKKKSNVADIVRQEIMSQLQGGGFWDELKDIIKQGEAEVAATVRFGKGKKAKDKVVEIPKQEFIEEHKHLVQELKKHEDTKEEAKEQEKELKAIKAKGKKGNPKLKQRGQLIKKIMAERGVSLAEASSIIKNENLL